MKAVAVGMGVVGGEGGEQHKARTHEKQPRGAGAGSARLETAAVGTSLPPLGGVCCGGQRRLGMWHLSLVAVMPGEEGRRRVVVGEKSKDTVFVPDHTRNIDRAACCVCSINVRQALRPYLSNGGKGREREVPSLAASTAGCAFLRGRRQAELSRVCSCTAFFPSSR